MIKTMKTLWIIVALGSFITISIFGLVLMPYHSSHDIACLASFINNAASPCPQADPVGFANFHSSAVKKISSFLLTDNLVMFYIIALLAFVLFDLLFGIGIKEKSINFLALYAFELQATSYQLPTRLAWFALHEKRDPALVF